MFPFDPHENIRKPNISYPLMRTRTGDQKRILGRKGLIISLLRAQGQSDKAFTLLWNILNKINMLLI